MPRKKSKPNIQTNIDLGAIVKDINELDTDDSESAMAKGILLALLQFSETSQVGKNESRAMAILSESNEVCENICNRMFDLRKEHKRLRAKEYIALIVSMSKSLGNKYPIPDSNRTFSRFRKNIRL